MRRLHWQRQSLTTTFLVGVLCALLPIAGLLGILWQQRRERDLQTALTSLTQTAESIAIVAEDALDDGVKLTRTLSTSSAVRSLSPAQFLGRLRDFQSIHPGYTNLVIVDARGAVLGWTGEHPPEEAVLGLGQSDIFDRVTRSRQTSVFFVPDAAAPDDVIGGMMAPIIGNDEAVIGVVVVVFDLSAIGDRLRQLRSFADQGLVLINRDGRIVLVISSAGRQAGGLSWQQRLRSSSPEVRAALAGQVTVSRSYLSPVIGDERLAVWMPIPKHGWVAGVTWPVAAALAPSRAAEQHELVIFTAIVLVLLIGAALAARAGVRPLHRLAEHAARFGDGDFEPIQGAPSKNEIGRLAQAFNRMGQRLHQTLADLHDERSHLESVLEQLPIGVVVVSAADGRVMRINAHGERFMARTSIREGQYDPSDPSMAFHLDGRPYLTEERPLGRAMRLGETIRSEEVLLRLAGEPDIVLNVTAAPIRDADGRIVAAVQTIQDVTEQRMAEVQFHQQNEMVRTLFDQFPGSLGIVDRDHRFVFFVAPDQYQEPFPRQVVGRTIDEISPPHRLEAAKARLRRALAGETVTAEDVLHDRVFNVIVCPLRDADGTISRVLVVRFDITEQRQTAARLREREVLLQAIVEQFPASINIVDRQLAVVMAGGKRMHGTGVTADEMSERNLADILQPNEAAVYRAAAERVFNGETVSTETRFRDRAIRATLTPLRNAAGTIDKVLNVAFDVTDDVARVERATRDEKLRALGQMAGGIAHDLNQALTLVSGYGELAREALASGAPAAESVSEMIRIMERAAYDGGATVKQLLTFARGGEHDEMQAIDVGVLLHDVEQLTAPRWRDANRAEGKRVTVRVVAAPGISLYGSQSGMREMLTNLVFNALDALPSGGTIVLSAGQTDGQVSIDVADTGTGMPPDVKARIFEPFFTTKGQAGSGLGMAMVFGIVERHRGQIDIESEMGRGTTIHLTFPVGEATSAEAVDTPDEPPARACRILVVDDEIRLASLLVGMLRYEGHEGVTAGSAEEALERLRSESFDLVISDLSMGDGMNGWELAAAIDGSSQPIPVILATGWGAGIDPDEAVSRGVSAVVAKPYRRSDLREVIATALTRQGVAATASGQA